MDTNNSPKIPHQLQTPQLAKLISLPNAMLIETPGLHGITTLQAMKVEPIYDVSDQGIREFREWQQVGDFQFKMMISPQRKVIRLELYDPMIFSILLEQLLDKGYNIKSSGEDVEFHPNTKGSGGWLGWAHLIKE